MASKWPDQQIKGTDLVLKDQRPDPLNTILGSDIGLEKCRSRQTDK